ncbi:MAG: protein kinase [Polyangia bacterium]
MAALLGQQIGKYRLVRVLGEGGLGAVYEGIRDDIGARAAVKLLHPEYARSPDAVTRFTNEARAANLVEHPSIVRIFDHGVLPDGRAYLAMELLAGEVLSSRIRRLRRLDPADVLRIGRQLAAALAAAHGKRVIHRDLKPANVMIVPDPEAPGGERAKLLDFGIAKLSTPGQQTKTRTGVIMGTPLYMSPEQCRGAGQVDEKSDVYSLGVMLFEMLTGTTPFRAEGDGELIAQHMFVPPPSVAQLAPATPPELVALIGAMLGKDPVQRPAMFVVVGEMLRLGRQQSATDLPMLGPPHGPVLGSTPGATPLPAPADSASTQPHPDEATTAVPPSLLNQNFEVVKRPRARSPLSSRTLALAAGGLVVLGGLAMALFGSGPSSAPELLKSASEAMAQQQWEAAAEKLHSVLAASSSSRREKEQARSQLVQVESEQKARLSYDRFTTAAGNGSSDAAIAAYRELPAGSSYRELGRGAYEKVLPLYTDFHLRAAEEALGQGRCAEAGRELSAVLTAEPKHAEALALRARPCPDDSRAERGRPGRKPGEPRLARATREPKEGKDVKEGAYVKDVKERAEAREPGDAAASSGVPGLTAAQVDEKLAKAQTDFVEGHYRRAIAQAMSVQTGNPTRAWRIIGSAACNLRDTQLATQAYKVAKGPERPALVETCRRNGVALVGSTFKLVAL